MKIYRTLVSFKCDICGNAIPSVDGDGFFLPVGWIKGEEPDTHICRGCVEFFGPGIGKGEVDPNWVKNFKTDIYSMSTLSCQSRRIEWLSSHMQNKESEQEWT